MEILMTDASSREGQIVAAELRADGHVVRACADVPRSNTAACAVLRDAECPLDRYPIDVAIDVGSAVAQHDLADAGLCAVRRRIPLVVVDRPSHPLAPWATQSVARSALAATVATLESAEMPVHTAEARRAVLAEMLRQGKTDTTTEVMVCRRNGGLVVHIAPDVSLDPREIELLAVHVLQRVRAVDPWATKIDVSTGTE